jgi:diguanylate cyclase (GGDEF)-like protein
MEKNSNINEFFDILKNKRIDTLFQPIINLYSGEIVGYEALSRGPENSIYFSPLNLIREAQNNNCLLELELLFREKALINSKFIYSEQLLFINVDPSIINEKNYKEGLTKDLIKKYNINSDSIVFEITERTLIKDYSTFNKVLKNYRNQGYMIAIDDVGSGYSGLRSICEFKPEYIKIDISLIKNIDKSKIKQSILKSLVELCKEENIYLIAEGVEREEELITLINLGVCAAQGFYIQRPSIIKNNNYKKVKYSISKNQNKKSIFVNLLDYDDNIGCLVENVPSIDLSINGCMVKDIFDLNDFEGLCILNNNSPTGLITKNKLNYAMSQRYGYNLYSSRPVSLIMDNDPLITDYYTPIKKIAEIAMNRPMGNNYDPIIVTKNTRYFGMVSIKKLLLYSTKLEMDFAKHLNPLTLLPGNIIINKIINKAINTTKEYCVLYIDLDNFKKFNDYNGFEYGDIIIKQTAEVIKFVVQEHIPSYSFIGHIGGDDFILVAESDFKKSEIICQNIIEVFDTFISKEKSGFNINNFLLTISIAGYFGKINKFKSPIDVGHHMSLLKKEAKKYNKSCYYLSCNFNNKKSSFHGFTNNIKIL